MAHSKKSLFSQLLIFSLFVSSLQINPVFCSEEKTSETNEITQKKIINSKLEKIIINSVVTSIIIGKYFFQFGIPIMQVFLLYQQINFFLKANNNGNNKTISEFISTENVQDISEDTLTEEQLKALNILKLYFPKKIRIKKYKYIPAIISYQWISEKNTIYKPCKNIKKEKNQLKMPQGYLFYGPPGTGKTQFAKKIAHELKAEFVSINCSNILNKYVGETEQNINKIFDQLKQKTKNNNIPIVAFFDEFDSLASDRGSLQSQPSNLKSAVGVFLEHFEKIRPFQTVILCVATNLPEMLDKAIIRGERLDTKIEFPLPNENLRIKFINSYFNDTKGNDSLIKYIAKNTNDLGYADIKIAIEKAKWNAYFENSDVLKLEHFGFQDKKDKVYDYYT